MTVYKYLHSHGLKFLSTLKLKLTSPADVDDPFEMRPQPGSAIVTEEMVGRMLASPDRMRAFFGLSGHADFDRWVTECQSHRETFRNWLGRELPGAVKQYCNQAAEATAKDYRMICFSKSNDNILMWSHYGDKHSGIVVGFDRDALQVALKARALDVDCRKERVVWGSEEFLFPSLHYAEQFLRRKSLSWAYQEEVRYVVKRGSDEFVSCPAKLVSSILLGAKFPAAEVPTVQRLMKNSGVRAELLCAFPDDNEFRLNFRRAP